MALEAPARHTVRDVQPTRAKQIKIVAAIELGGGNDPTARRFERIERDGADQPHEIALRCVIAIGRALPIALPADRRVGASAGEPDGALNNCLKWQTADEGEPIAHQVMPPRRSLGRSRQVANAPGCDRVALAGRPACSPKIKLLAPRAGKWLEAMPWSRSAWSASIRNAHSKGMPRRVDICRIASNLPSGRESVWCMRGPTTVDLPGSTWPPATILRLGPGELGG